jgi:membrane protease subunit HflC
MQQVTANARKQTRKFGIEVVDVRIKRADLPTEVEESVFARMRAERERVAKQYRSEGEEEAAKLRADTDKEKAIILAKAYQGAQELRGQGDAESIKVYAEAYGKNPEFYAFMRSLDTYEKAIDGKSTVVLSTGSDLFQYLADPTKKR